MSRMYKNRMYSPEQDVVMLFASFDVDASGAVSADQGANIAVTKLATAGQYKIALSESYNRLLGAQFQVVCASNSGVFSIEILDAPSTLQSDFKSNKAFTIQCYDAAGAAVNPANPSKIMVELKVRRSAVGYFDV